MPLDMTQFHQAFYDETAEHLSTMESLLLYLDPQDPEPLPKVRRKPGGREGGGEWPEF
jgi:chemotaxis protein histidine kinase CheA